MHVPLIVWLARYLDGKRKSSSSGLLGGSSPIHLKSGWEFDVGGGLILGFLGTFILASWLGLYSYERWAFAIAGCALGGGAGFGLASALSSTEQIVLAVLAALLLGFFVVAYATVGAAAAAAPSVVSALPLILA